MDPVVKSTNYKINSGLIFSALCFLIPFLPSCSEKESSASVQDFRVPIYQAADNKLWAHHMNNLDSAKRRIQEFPGIEIDVVFEEDLKKFNVRHDLDDASSSYYLDDFLAQLDEASGSAFYWIDFKNLNAQNAKAAIEELNRILEKKNLKKRVIVESFMANEIVEVNKNGIFTSFWVPHLDGNSSKDDTLRALNLIQEVIASEHVNALSAHWVMYEFLNRHFPEENIHLWTNGLISEKDKEIIQSLVERKNIRVILVDYPHNFLK